jgi:hypothetical protein
VSQEDWPACPRSLGTGTVVTATNLGEIPSPVQTSAYFRSDYDDGFGSPRKVSPSRSWIPRGMRGRPRGSEREGRQRRKLIASRTTLTVAEPPPAAEFGCRRVADGQGVWERRSTKRRSPVRVLLGPPRCHNDNVFSCKRATFWLPDRPRDRSRGLGTSAVHRSALASVHSRTRFPHGESGKAAADSDGRARARFRMKAGSRQL